MSLTKAHPVDISAVGRKDGARSGIAERLWDASRVEFSLRGYHGARVQGIARRAGCNVALLYRHWSSKKALYLDLLRSTWQSSASEVVALIEQGTGAPAVVGAYLDALMRDAVGAQILIREFLDGGPFLSQLVQAEPALVDSVRRAARAMAAPGVSEALALRPGLDPTLAVLTISGLAALVASVHEATRLLTEVPVPAEAWRQHLYEMLLHGVLACPAPGEVTPPSRR
jgi:TetR/AcrR family transcriptional regulator